MKDEQDVTEEQAATEARSGSEEASKRGWAAQPRALKVLLIVSIALTVFGVTKCTFEMTEPRSGDEATEQTH